MINDFSGYLTTMLSVNQQLKSINLVRCTKELILSESFFCSKQNQLQGLEKLNLSQNNAHLVDWRANCFFMAMIVKNHNVDFSMNPLYK